MKDGSSKPIALEKHWRNDPKNEEEAKIIEFKNQYVASKFKVIIHQGKMYHLEHTKETVEEKLKELNLYRDS